MSEHTVSDLCRAVLEHDERATPGAWFLHENGAIRSEKPHVFGIPNLDRFMDDHKPWCAFVDEKTANGELIAHYRSACPTIAREYLRLAERLALAEAVCEGVAMYATVETDERLLMLHHKWLIAKDPQGEGEV